MPDSEVLKGVDPRHEGGQEEGHEGPETRPDDRENYYQGIGVSKGSSTFTSPPPSPDLRRFRGSKVERSAGLEGDLGTVAPTRRC